MQVKKKRYGLIYLFVGERVQFEALQFLFLKLLSYKFKPLACETLCCKIPVSVFTKKVLIIKLGLRSFAIQYVQFTSMLNTYACEYT